MGDGASRTGTGRHRPLWIVAAAIIVLDQITKAVVLSTIELHDTIPVVDGLLNLVHVRNPGAAFSLLADAPAALRTPFFVGITIAAVVALTWIALRLPDEERLLRIAMGAVLGGAVGNLIDRVAYGEVIDFIDVYWGRYHWPAFNVADSAISVAVVTVILQSVAPRRRVDQGSRTAES